MAYALLCAGGSGTSAPVVSMSTPWVPSNQADWGCRIKIKTGSDITTDRMICGNEANGFGNDRFKFAVTGGAIVCLYGPYWNTTDWLRYVVTANTEYDLLYRVTSTQFQLWNNATNTLLVSKTLGVRAGSGSAMGRNVVGRTTAQNSAQSPAGMIYYNVDFIDYATPANTLNYDANLSGGTGTIFPTTQGTNNGTQVGTWPANDAEWVFYSTGTAYADTLQQGTYTSSGGVLASFRGVSDTLNGGSYTSAGSTLAATQGYSSQLNGGSYTSAGGQLSSSLGFNSTLQGATFTSSGGQLTSTRGYGDTLTGGSYSYAGGILVSTVSGAAQSYVDALLGGSYTSSGASLASNRGYTSQLQGGNYTSSGGSLSAFYGYSSTLDGGSYAYAGNRLISTWSGEVTVTIEGYTIRFADDSISAKFHADDVSATFDNDHVSVTWRH